MQRPTTPLKDPAYLDGQFLVAMPGIGDERFARSVIYLCAHAPEGAMGLVVNQAADNVTFPHVIGQLGIQASAAGADTPVLPSLGWCA